MSKKDIVEYHEKFGHIPKDYMERLAYLYRLKPFTKENFNSLMAKIEQLTTMEWDSVTYIFYMNPKSTPRARLNPKTFTFYVKDAKNYKRVFDEFREKHSNMECVISTPAMISTKVYMETPKNMSVEEMIAAELELIHHTNNPDWDNLGKTYSDMVQKTLVSNDSIICKGSVEKLYSILPRIEVTIHFMTKYDCRYNKRCIENRKSFKENPLTLKDINSII